MYFSFLYYKIYYTYAKIDHTNNEMINRVSETTGLLFHAIMENLHSKDTPDQVVLSNTSIQHV